MVNEYFEDDNEEYFDDDEYEYFEDDEEEYNEDGSHTNEDGEHCYCDEQECNYNDDEEAICPACGSDDFELTCGDHGCRCKCGETFTCP